MPAVAATNPPVLIAHGGGGHRADPGRLGRRDAAQPRAAGGGRAVRAARGRPSGPDRPRHRPGARHRPGHQLGAAARRRRRQRRGGRAVPGVRRQRAGDDGARGASGWRWPAAPTRCGPPRAASVAARCGCSAPRTTPPGWPRRRGCPTCSPTTSPATAPPRRSSSTARTFRPSPELDGAADVPDRQRGRGGRRPRRPSGSRCRSCWRWWRCAPGRRSAPQLLVEEAEKVDVPDAHRPLIEAMRPRWVVGTPTSARAQLDGPRGDVRRRRGDGPPGGRRPRGHGAGAQPGPRADPAAAGRLTASSDSVSEPPRTRLACRPNVGPFRGASRLPGPPRDARSA